MESYEIGIPNGAYQTIADAGHPDESKCIESYGERVICNSAEMAAYLFNLINEANVAWSLEEISAMMMTYASFI